MSLAATRPRSSGGHSSAQTRWPLALALALVVWGIPVLAFGQDADTVPDLDVRSGITIGDAGANVAGPTSPTGIGRPPRVGPNVRANGTQQALPNGLLGRSETTSAASTDGQFVVVGFNDAQGFCGPPFGAACTPETPPGLSGYAYSSDGGLTFTDGGSPDPAVFGNVFTRGDPWLALGGFDNATYYFANLSVDATSGADLGVSVHRGHFDLSGVLHWEDVRVFNAPAAPNDFYDKEAISAAQDGSGTAYVSVTNFAEECGVPQAGFGQIEVWRTHDGGNTWQGPTVVSPDMSDPGCAGGTLQQSSNSAIGPNGEVYVTWQLGPHLGPTSTGADIVVATSLDGGVTFGAPVLVANINSVRNDPQVGYNRDRQNDHPRIAVATSGPFKGRVYVTYYSAVAPVTAAPVAPCPAPLPGLCRAQRLTSIQAFVEFSDDRGATWSSPAPVAPAPPASGVKRFWPVVTVEPGGNVDVVYYESQETSIGTTCTINVGGGVRRRGPAVSLVDTFWAQSMDGGATFASPIKVSTATSNWCTAVSNIRPNFGDYIGSASGGNRVFPSWADSRNGVPDAFFSQLLGAGKAK